MLQRFSWICLTIGLLATTPAGAQWLELQDPESGLECGVINAENVRLVMEVAADAGSSGLILISGPDTRLLNIFVDAAGDVIIDGESVGFVQFSNDVNGQRRAFWLAQNNTVYRLNSAGQPVATDFFPGELTGACDPCETGLWDDDADCSEPPPPDEGGSLGDTLVPALVTGLCGAAVDQATLASMGFILIMRPRRRFARRRR
ncbi:MAG: hypothetical protein GY778_30965 [bacterium]|nr:hypothetical protein [bacterium]